MVGLRFGWSGQAGTQRGGRFSRKAAMPSCASALRRWARRPRPARVRRRGRAAAGRDGPAPLRPGEALRPAQGEGGDDLRAAGLQPVRRHQLVHQPHGERLRGVEAFPGQQDAARPPRADGVGEEGRDEARHQPVADLGEGEPRLRHRERRCRRPRRGRRRPRRRRPAPARASASAAATGAASCRSGAPCPRSPPPPTGRRGAARGSGPRRRRRPVPRRAARRREPRDRAPPGPSPRPGRRPRLVQRVARLGPVQGGGQDARAVRHLQGHDPRPSRSTRWAMMLRWISFVPP